jgi:hypothetical protein
MRRILLILVLFVGMVSWAPGQCGPQGCPTPTQSSAPQKAPYTALVAVHQSDGTVGTGSIVHADGKVAEVLTCAHGYNSALQTVIVTQDGRRWKATAKGVDPVQDVAVFRIADPRGIRPIALAQSQPKPGVRLFACGYAAGRIYRGTWARLTQWVGPGKGLPFTWLEINAPVQSGMSGGPILNERREIVGLITGGDSDVCVGPCLPRVRAALRFLLPPYRPIMVVPPQPLVPVTPPQPVPAEPEGITQLQSEVQELKAQIAILTQQIAELTNTPGPPGPRGPRGLPGPKGPRGPAGAAGQHGENATLDIDSIAQQIKKEIQGSIRVEVRPIPPQ